MAKPTISPLGQDGRSLSFMRPGATVSPFPTTLASGAADTSGAIDAQGVFINVVQFHAFLHISAAGTAATANDLRLEPGVLYTFALRKGDKVSLIGSDGTGDIGHVWTAATLP